jgi:hypothetical protein
MYKRARPPTPSFHRPGVLLERKKGRGSDKVEGSTLNASRGEEKEFFSKIMFV